MSYTLKFPGIQLDLAEPAIMGVLNVTPDSFSDGGKFIDSTVALNQVELMLNSGASIIDVGGESTRPGAEGVSVSSEIDRVVPVVRAIKREFDCLVSVDTKKSEVLSAALGVGADMVNDVNALQAEGMESVVKSFPDCPICIMHMQGQPQTMQANPRYLNVTDEVVAFLDRRVKSLVAAGIARERFVLDPGFGFGKSLEHNYELARGLEKLTELKLPVLAGVSRKSMVGNLLNLPINERDVPSAILAALLVGKGANIIRAHDVSYTKQAIILAQQLSE